MKRFLRYVIYRELYRWMRRATSDSDTGQSSAVEPDKRLDEVGSTPQTGDHHIDEGPIETVGELQAIIQLMDPYDFEEFVAELWERMGWTTEVPAPTMDEGVDVIAQKELPYEQTTLIQAKRYSSATTVGSPEVQQYGSLLHQYDNIDKVAIVTTNEFTEPARELAGRLNVKLINGRELAELVARFEAADLIAKYVDEVELERRSLDDPPDPETPGNAEGSSASSQPADETDAQPVEEQSIEDVEPDLQAVISSAPWTVGIVLTIVGWSFVIVSAGRLSTHFWGPVFLAVWVGLPASIFLDLNDRPDEFSWPRYPWAYVLVSFVWFVCVLVGSVYLIQRYRRTAAYLS